MSHPFRHEFVPATGTSCSRRLVLADLSVFWPFGRAMWLFRDIVEVLRWCQPPGDEMAIRMAVTASDHSLYTHLQGLTRALRLATPDLGWTPTPEYVFYDHTLTAQLGERGTVSPVNMCFYGAEYFGGPGTAQDAYRWLAWERVVARAAGCHANDLKAFDLDDIISGLAMGTFYSAVNQDGPFGAEEVVLLQRNEDGAIGARGFRIPLPPASAL